MRIISLIVLMTLFGSFGLGQGNELQQFIRVQAPVVALQHVRVIDGTGTAAAEDRTVIISGGKISTVGPTASTQVPGDAKILDLTGYTVMPGLVGMHDHLFFPMGGTPPMYSNMGISFPRLYLALGVTTIRTTGSVAPFADLEIKRQRAPWPCGRGAPCTRVCLRGLRVLTCAGD